MKPFITWRQSNGISLGLAGDTVFFTLTEVSGKKDKPVYDLHFSIMNRSIANYRSIDDAKFHAEKAVEHFLKILGFWQCIVDRENTAA